MLEEKYKEKIRRYDYGRLTISTDEKVLTTYLMLQKRQKVNHQIIEQKFDICKRTFYRLIATIRQVLETENDFQQIIYSHTAKTYMLVKLNVKPNPNQFYDWEY